MMEEVEAGAEAPASPWPLLLGRHLQPLLQTDKSMPAVRQAATRSTVQWNGRQVHAPVSTILTTQTRWATTKAELCWAQSWPLASLLSRLQDQDSRRWRELPGSTVQEERHEVASYQSAAKITPPGTSTTVRSPALQAAAAAAAGE